MEIIFDKSKECSAYSRFINNPEDRQSERKFKKYFSQIKLSTALRIHKNLIDAETAKRYNDIFGQTDNRIELQTGIKDSDNLILKNRITDSYRKFYHPILPCECDKQSECTDCEKLGFTSVKEWQGDFSSIQRIFIFDINNHDYKQAKRKG